MFVGYMMMSSPASWNAAPAFMPQGMDPSLNDAFVHQFAQSCYYQSHANEYLQNESAKFSASGQPLGGPIGPGRQCCFGCGGGMVQSKRVNFCGDTINLDN